MWKLIDKILSDFRKVFSRQVSFEWFVVIAIGLMVRTDILGTTSIIRHFSLTPDYYSTINHFFRASSWKIKKINCWAKIINHTASISKVDEYTILLGDGVKQAKEGKKMPGIKKLHQKSENSSKPEYMFEGIGVLIGNANKNFCVPVSIKIHDGVSSIREWADNSVEKNSHVNQTITDGYQVAKTMGKSILILDRYFISVNALEKLDELKNKFKIDIHLIINAKKSCISHEKKQLDPSIPEEKDAS